MRFSATMSLVFVVVLALSGAARAEVAMAGVLSTGSYDVIVDSADVRIDTVSLLVPTPGWGGDSLTLDTFSFPPLTRWPTAVKLFYKVESTLVLPVSPVVRDSWYVLPGFGATEPRVMFHELGGIVESPLGRLRSMEFSVTPSVAAGSAFIGAQLGSRVRYRIEVFDAAGNRIRTLSGAATDRGRVSLRWQGDDDLGSLLPGGVYYCRLSIEGVSVVRKLILTR